MILFCLRGETRKQDETSAPTFNTFLMPGEIKTRVSFLFSSRLPIATYIFKWKKKAKHKYKMKETQFFGKQEAIFFAALPCHKPVRLALSSLCPLFKAVPSINLGNAENRTRGCWVQSKSAIHCAMRPPPPRQKFDLTNLPKLSKNYHKEFSLASQ